MYSHAILQTQKQMCPNVTFSIIRRKIKLLAWILTVFGKDYQYIGLCFNVLFEVFEVINFLDGILFSTKIEWKSALEQKLIN